VSWLPGETPLSWGSYAQLCFYEGREKKEERMASKVDLWLPLDPKRLATIAFEITRFEV